MLANLVAAALLVSLIIYALTGGADYGGGVWDLFAFGPRAEQQRRLIEDSIGPIWEADHVWLILIVVILFTGFPPAFAAISTALNLPLLGMLIGIVLRGAAFSFHAYGPTTRRFESVWQRVFAIASAITPILLGIIVGALASERLPLHPARLSDFVWPWLGLFPLAVGAFALILFAYLAAIYATVQATPGSALQEDFRWRGLISAVLFGFVASGVLLLSRTEAPHIWHGLTERVWTWPLIWTTSLLALLTIYALWTRRFQLARWCAAGHVVFILLGWGAAQFPYLVVPSITIAQAASNPLTLKFLLGALIFGGAILLPSFAYLYSLFGVGHGGATREVPLRPTRRFPPEK
jgi:cytochrome bd ubiquinol oxidase subunit II